MNEDKATIYHRLRRRAQAASLVLVGGWAVWATWQGGGVWLAGVARAAAAASGASGAWQRAVTVIVAAGIMAATLELLALPGAWYLGFVLERRYELSRRTAAEWWRDHAKAAALGLGMAMVAASVVYAAIDRWPAAWWLAAGLALALLETLLALGAPVALLPLFYRFEPLPSGTLAARLEALTRRAGTPVLGVYTWRLGDRTRVANAALVGLGPTRRVLLSDTLLEQYSADEIEVIVAHELAHHVNRDIWNGVVIEAAQGTLALLAGHVALVALGPRLSIDGPGDVAGMPLLALAAGAWVLASAPWLLVLSRRHERRADRYALDLTGNAEAFISAMRRLGSRNLADEMPSRIVEWLFHSHPPLSERIASARRWAEEHGRANPRP